MNKMVYVHDSNLARRVSVLPIPHSWQVAPDASQCDGSASSCPTCQCRLLLYLACSSTPYLLCCSSAHLQSKYLVFSRSSSPPSTSHRHAFDSSQPQLGWGLRPDGSHKTLVAFLFISLSTCLPTSRAVPCLPSPSNRTSGSPALPESWRPGKCLTEPPVCGTLTLACLLARSRLGNEESLPHHLSIHKRCREMRAAALTPCCFVCLAAVAGGH